MSLSSAALPPSFTRWIAPETRKQLGISTHEENLAKLAAREEKELQRQIASLLRLHGIEADVSAFHKRTTRKTGWPDFTFAVWLDGATYQRCPVAWECKRPGEKLRPEQEQLRQKLITPPNAWRYDVIYTVAEAVAILRELGVIK